MSPTERSPDFSLFLQIIQTLEALDAPYMVIGGFAAALHGITRTTYDVNMIVNLTSQHIDALVQAFRRLDTMPIHSRCVNQFVWV
jgi:hypothetical protein